MGIDKSIDACDEKILRELQKNGKLTVNELSEKVNLSPSPVGRRVRHLEKSGYIKGYAALVNEYALGFKFSAFVSVKLDKQSDTVLADFEHCISQLPEVVECWLMTGNFDYLLRVATSGLQEFEYFLVRRLTKTEGVSSIESSVPIRRVKTGLARTA